ncbi:MAG: radical SAM protein [Kamptonema sp. SIO1D9]|nr:radical SAM protein [Kamptonema sp. SIO1D9]
MKTQNPSEIRSCSKNVCACAPNKTIQWRINCDCDEICTFCIGADELHEVKPDESMAVFDKLIDGGASEIIITGGEPLLSTRLDRMLRHLHERSVKVVLYTNCKFWDFHDETIRTCVDTVCVPIEGASEFVHDGVRGKNNLRKILSILDRYARDASNRLFTVRVGTAVGRHNLNELEAIAYMLSHYQIESWTLHKHVRYTDRVVRNYFKKHRANISLAEFETTCRKLINESEFDLPIQLSTEIQRDSNFLMLNQDLALAVPVRDENGRLVDRVLADVETYDVEELVETWRTSVQMERYEDAFKISL